ncbi:MAG: hypothetical protein A4E45_00986 [Methanosaeta sp. PtaB.Bin039]|nr:MAG: hypothetical protein A4E45_00986 [Methanosaeta sp. PtaB.Bin039]OPY44721.1 MAG: hypothetical protein A4E47_01348 [Methanosaeta sp. PtaU1.Bin028]
MGHVRHVIKRWLEIWLSEYMTFLTVDLTWTGIITLPLIFSDWGYSLWRKPGCPLLQSWERSRHWFYLDTNPVLRSPAGFVLQVIDAAAFFCSLCRLLSILSGRSHA